MAELISPSGLLSDDIYTGYALNKFSWNYDSSVDDDVDAGQYYLAISEGHTPEDAPQWIYDRKMNLDTFKTGKLSYPPSLSLFKSGVTYYWDMMYIIDGEEYYEGAKMFKVPEKPEREYGKSEDEVDPEEAEINSMHTKSEGSAKPLGPPIPGVGDPAKKADEVITKQASDHSKQIKMIAGGLLLAIMTGSAIKNIPEVNRRIEKLNTFNDKIKSTADDLKKFLSDINVVIKIIRIAFLAASIIALIPAVTVGLGAGVAFTMHITTANAIKTACETLQDKIGKIPFAILSIILLLLALLKFIQAVIGLINMFLDQQSNLKNDAISDSIKTADDWGNTTSREDYDIGDKDGNKEDRINIMKEINKLQFVSCTLPSGEVKQMTPEACLAAGGTFGVSCTLPSGEVKQMTQEACLAAGGTFGDMSDLEYDLNKLGGPIYGVCLSGAECENLTYEECLNSPGCWWEGGDLIITSLLNRHQDVTVEKATKRKGRRYGFYQSETGDAMSIPTTSTKPPRDEYIDPMDKYYELYPPKEVTPKPTKEVTPKPNGKISGEKGGKRR